MNPVLALGQIVVSIFLIILFVGFSVLGYLQTN